MEIQDGKCFFQGPSQSDFLKEQHFKLLEGNLCLVCVCTTLLLWSGMLTSYHCTSSYIFPCNIESNSQRHYSLLECLALLFFPNQFYY